ncbi:phage tail protein [Undibacterium flavidum]|uniref:Phage tail protein n=1 Tax=Undibacterium flavidum TaxID=2762297 RepID=A0ABR6YFK9_9BURK|nr:phage tail protein [Undibacterium flavidum]MBC3875298.1 phage tail protein [Undibacterium flavidum]
MSGEYFELGYPPSAFYFSVGFVLGVGATGIQVPDASFSEVSGIGTEMETEAVVEGGENRFVHQLPKQIKHGNLELKRGIANANSPLYKWCKSTLEGEFIKMIEAKSVLVKLIGGNKQILRAWEFHDAYPVKWDVEAFNSTKNDVAVEKIAFAYTYSQRIR